MKPVTAARHGGRHHPARRPLAAGLPGPAAARGFTLVEIAIATMILGLLAVGIIGSLSQQAEQRRFAETRTQLDRARGALLAFVTTNGRLPCPATTASAGQEVITSAPTANPTTCAAEAGLLPAVTLGMPDVGTGGWVENGWNDSASAMATRPRALRYGVSRLSGTEQHALTSSRLGATDATAGTRRAAVQARFANGEGWFVCASSTGIVGAGNRCGNPANALALAAAAAVWSTGGNGHRAAAWSADERQNALVTVPRVAISRTVAPEGAVGGAFDDQVTWLPFTLVAERLVVTGLLP